MTEAPYFHIACCIEDSPGSRRALDEARRLRGFGPGRLTLLHVTPSSIISGESLGTPPDDEIVDAASTWLAEQSAAVPEAQSVLLSGHPASVVCAWARDHQPDLLVAGAHRGRLERVALGSFASYLAYHAPCPVLLVRPPER
jgi:nucleotide-binding universal stress UspA family protein